MVCPVAGLAVMWYSNVVGLATNGGSKTPNRNCLISSLCLYIMPQVDRRSAHVHRGGVAELVHSALHFPCMCFRACSGNNRESLSEHAVGIVGNLIWAYMRN